MKVPGTLYACRGLSRNIKWTRIIILPKFTSVPYRYLCPLYRHNFFRGIKYYSCKTHMGIFHNVFRKLEGKAIRAPLYKKRYRSPFIKKRHRRGKDQLENKGTYILYFRGIRGPGTVELSEKHKGK